MQYAAQMFLLVYLLILWVFLFAVQPMRDSVLMRFTKSKRFAQFSHGLAILTLIPL